MISRRVFGKGLAALSMTRGDRLPGGRRPDQQYDPPGALVAPGSKTGPIRTRQVIVNAGGTPPAFGVFIYDHNGNLIASMAAAAGTGPEGGTVLQGIVSYASPAAVQVNGDNITLGPQAATGSRATIFPANDASNFGLTISSGNSGGTDVSSSLFLVPKSNGTPALTVVDGRDGNLYGTEYQRQEATGQTVSGAGFVPVTGFTGLPLTAHTYGIKGQLIVQGGGTGTAQFGLFGSGGLVVANMQVMAYEVTVPAGLGGGSITTGNGANINALGAGAAFVSTALGAALRCVRFEGSLTVTTAGTITPQVQGTVGNTWLITKGGTYIEYIPE